MPSRISQLESENQMSISNLSIVFGPTLLGAPPATAMANSGQPMNGNGNGPVVNAASMGDNAHWQNRAIETILEHYIDIFVDEGDS